MSFPDLSALHLKPQDDVRTRWLLACGTHPNFMSWKRMRGKHKHALLHSVADAADDDESENGDYLSAYEQRDIDELLAMDLHSVEHVVPRSHVNGGDPGAAENDPIGWIVATRSANSRRSNWPLYLWPDPDSSIAIADTFVRVDGEQHYVPPLEQRARLARKWLFIRATYPGISTPSAAQTRRASKIIELAQYWPVQSAEQRVNQIYRKNLGWGNPLLEDKPEQWYADAAWCDLIFGAVRH